MSCLIAAGYRMLADVYGQTQIQLESGEILRSHTILASNVPCSVRGVKTASVQGTGRAERFTNEYIDNKALRMKCQAPISQRSQIRNIRDSRGLTPWGDSVFEVMGCDPLMGPFGFVQEYEIILEKV